MAHLSVVSNLYPPYVKGGYELLADEFVQYARAKKMNVSVLTSAWEETPVEKDGVDWSLKPSQPWNSAPVFRPGPKVRSGVYNFYQALKFYRSVRPSKVFFWNLNRIGLGPIAAAHLLKIPVYCTFNDYYPLQYVDHRIVTHFMKQPFFQTWGSLGKLKCTFISEYLQHDLANQGFDPPQANVIYQGTDMNLFPRKQDAWSVHSPLRLLYVGTLSHDKGVDTFLESLVDLSHVTATLIGGGAENKVKEYKSFVQENHLRDRVHFTGPVPRQEIKFYLHQHDVLVFPSRWPEPFGLTHIEAVASGLFLITTSVGGVREFLTSGVFAEVFQEGNVQQLQECIHKVINYKEDERQKALKSSEWVRRHFDLGRYCEELWSFLEFS